MMNPPISFEKLEKVILTVDGEQYLAQIALASPNSVSLMLTFESIVAGHVGMMPLLWERDSYYSIISGIPAEVRKWQ
jgi:hypothetical protein